MNRNVVITGILIYATFGLVGGMLDSLLDALGAPPEEEDAGGPLFIPFPGTTKKIEPKPYRGSDPEWQGFVKFSKDQELAKRIRGRSSSHHMILKY